MTSRIFIGVIAIAIGLAIFFFHREIIRAWVHSNFENNWWTGKFTRGGRIFLRVLGALIVLYGIIVVLGVIY